jgi:hypothetical protein
MKETKVYLAGKISSKGWREELIPIRNNFSGNEKSKIRNGYTLKYNDEITIVGPFFLSCDHSCYHGDNSHGVGLNNYYEDNDGTPYDCYGYTTDLFTEKEVYNICIEQIKKSDIVFAYIDDLTCFGTLFELGYAASIGKDIIILYDYKFPSNDMWFINRAAKIFKHKELKTTSVKEMFDKIVIPYIKNKNIRNKK